MSKYPSYHASYLRAHFQGIGAASAGSGIGINDPSTIMGIPVTSGTPTDGQVIVYSAANNAWILGSAAPAFADPTATASDVAVNGVATTAMRSDAAPAVQKASSSVFGLVKPDGTIITVSSGVITVATSTTSVLGVSKPDGSTITVSGGVYTRAALTGDVTTSGNAATIKTDVSLAGNPTTTTQSSSDNSTRIATTAYVQTVATGGYVPTGAAAHPGYISGKVYGPIGGVTGASRTFATGVLDCVLVYIPVATSFTAISVNLASNSSVTSIDFGVYANTNGFPGALVQNIGTLVVSSTGVKSKSATITLAPGWYWLGVWMNGTAGVTALSALTSGLLGQTNAQTPLGNNMATQTISYSAGNLPNPFAGALAGQNITNICLTAP